MIPKKRSVLFFFTLFSVLFAQTCNPINGNETFNPDCTSQSQPYCRETEPSIFSCVKCITECDCELDDYCSRAPGQVGQCKDWGIEGDSCRPLSIKQLVDPNFPEDWKCARIFTNSTGQIEIDAQGICREGTCRICGVRQQTGLGPCFEDSGIGLERVCVFPGFLERTHFANWSSGNYYEDPALVWWAIFFGLVIIWIVLNCGILSTSCAALIFQKWSFSENTLLKEQETNELQNIEDKTTQEIEEKLI